ncbi:MAG: hypothetical protein N2442_10580 [Spirochaetes bacterium]|nr:hypothetical protein [Spirochaetota bacterium]
MKVLLICEREKVKDQLVIALSSYLVEVIWYRDPIKAMDNLDEIDPDTIVLSAADFPRHWKVFLAFVQGTIKKSVSVFLLISDTFDREEKSKAEALGVQGIFHEELRNETEWESLINVLHPPAKGKGEQGIPTSKESFFEPSPKDRIELLFLHPETLHLIEGKITRIGKETLWFLPSKKEKTQDLTPPLHLPACSFRVGSSLHTIDLELLENREQLVLRFLQIPPELAERF